MKNARAYLDKPRLLDAHIRQKETELERLRLGLGSISVSTQGERVQTSRTGDRLANDVARVVDLEKEIEQKKIELITVRNAVIHRIHRLNNTVLVDILYKKYVEYKSYKEIAIELSYNISYVRRLHSKALKLL